MQEEEEKLPVIPPVRLQATDPWGQPAVTGLAVLATVAVQVVGLPDATLFGEQLTLTLVSSADASVNVVPAVREEVSPVAVRKKRKLASSSSTANPSK